MGMTKSQLRRARIAARQPKVIDSRGLSNTDMILEGRYCQTALIVPSSGRMVALQGTILTVADEEEIEGIRTLREDLVMGKRPNTVFQKAQARGTGLVDEAGNVY